MTRPGASCLALGDSYTIGEAVAIEQRWPAQLVASLRQGGLAMAEPEYIACTGWSCDELAAAIAQHTDLGHYDLVTLLIGVNDQYRGHPAESRRASMLGLLQRAIALAGRPEQVLAVSIPDWSVTPFAQASGRDLDHIAQQIDGYNHVLQTLAAGLGVTWIDITGYSRQYPHELAADGLHPSGAQYARWSQAVLPAARRSLTATIAGH